VKVSVIIVSYEVKYFLELCLRSVEKAMQGLEAEILVVDNHSGDGSLAYLEPRFPRVRFLANRENTGFGRACNQALEQASGEYILFLNPDTVLPEDFTSHCLAFLAAMPRIGGLGVRMIDGGGRFLKESCRGFPTPWVAFCRLSGLAALFPRSRVFSGYYLGHLSPDTAHPAPVLSGACFWVRRAILGEVGAFDERFFLYAEDIDLSFRIERAGYTNYYSPGATIVHFKGESTRKDTRYVRQFYGAMRQFRRKHLNGGWPAVLDWGIQAAIQVRSGMAVVAGVRSAARDVRDSGPLRTFLLGDPEETVRVGVLLEATGKRTIVGKEEDAEEIVLCEGEGFSFRECIRQLEALGRAGKQRIKFHGKGCGSAAGSPDRKDRGEVLVL
jgi:GT2 family glycosyltransferase